MKIAAEDLGGLELVLSKAQAAARAAEGDLGLSVGDIHRIAENFLRTTRPLLFWFENLWERKFKEVARRY
jgi:hypothetical protein